MKILFTHTQRKLSLLDYVIKVGLVNGKQFNFSAAKLCRFTAEVDLVSCISNGNTCYGTQRPGKPFISTTKANLKVADL